MKMLKAPKWKYPAIVNVETVVEDAKSMAAEIVDQNGQKRWVPCRGLGFGSIGQRLKATWLVFAGKADALLWTGQ